MSVKSAVEAAIKDNHVVVFSKSYCPYCTRAKSTLASSSPLIFELDTFDEGADWQAYLGDKTGQRTVPSIFIDGEFIGGNSDLQKLAGNGELVKKLAGKL